MSKLTDLVELEKHLNEKAQEYSTKVETLMQKCAFYMELQLFDKVAKHTRTDKFYTGSRLVKDENCGSYKDDIDRIKKEIKSLVGKMELRIQAVSRELNKIK